MNTFLIVFSALLVLFSIMPLIKNDYWTFRVFDYPRLQKFVLTVVCFILIVILYEGNDIIFWILTLIMAGNAAFLLYNILPFTILSKKHVLKASVYKDGEGLSVMIANVYQDNTNTTGCLNEIKKADPDIVLLLETNNKWKEGTDALEKNYLFHVKIPKENTYGMLLYSKLELIDAQVKYLVEDDIPSIHTQVKLQNGKIIRLYCLHPTPPVPNENLRSTERDKELLLVADMAKNAKTPVIVIGDLNDVAWSYTTELFLKMSGLLDPRRGRGFFNSFHAHYPFMRFPLDHAFISTEFKLRSIKRLNNFGSDHFPIYLDVQYDASAAAEQESMKPDADDLEEAQEKKEKE